MDTTLLSLVLALSTVQTDKLSSEIYREREEASKQLLLLLPFSLPAIQTAYKSTDYEVYTRSKRLLDYWKRKEIDFILNNNDFYPWIDMHPKFEDNVYLDRFLKESRTINCYIPNWYHYRIATKLWVDHELKNKVSIYELKKVLLEMYSKEEEWHLKNSGHKIIR